MECITNLEDFKSTVVADRDVFIKVSSSTCAPCKMMEPVFKKLAEEHESFSKVFIEVEVDTCDGDLQQHMKSLGIRDLPTFLKYSNKELELNFKGAMFTNALTKSFKLI